MKKLNFSKIKAIVFASISIVANHSYALTEKECILNTLESVQKYTYGHLIGTNRPNGDYLATYKNILQIDKEVAPNIPAIIYSTTRDDLIVYNFPKSKFPNIPESDFHLYKVIGGRASELATEFRKLPRACGAINVIGFTNPELQLAISGKKIYPSHFNTSKLNSDWIARLRLQLFYNNRWALQADANSFKSSYTEIDRERDAQTAFIETAKALGDIALLNKNKKDVNGYIGVVYLQGMTHALSASNSMIASSAGSAPLPSDQVDYLKAVASTVHFLASSDPSSYIDGAANAMKSKIQLNNEGTQALMNKSIDVVSAGAQCYLSVAAHDETGIRNCLWNQAELGAKAFVDIKQSIKLQFSTRKANASNAAADYLSKYFEAGGDINHIKSRLPGLNGLDYQTVANYYESVEPRVNWVDGTFGRLIGGIDKEHFIKIVSKYMDQVNAATNHFRKRIEN